MKNMIATVCVKIAGVSRPGFYWMKTNRLAMLPGLAHGVSAGAVFLPLYDIETNPYKEDAPAVLLSSTRVEWMALADGPAPEELTGNMADTAAVYRAECMKRIPGNLKNK